MRRRVAASLRRRRTVRYFFIFVVLHASFSFGVWPIGSRSGCDGVTLFMRPFLVTLRGSCEVPRGGIKTKNADNVRVFGGGGGGSEIPENADILGGFFSSKIFFFTGVVHDFDQNL